MPDIIDHIRRQFDRGGEASYGEALSMREHMIQAAFFAEREGADEAVIAAALLHDYGHLIGGLPEDIAKRGIDDRHEHRGADALAEYLPPRVIEPIRLHVAAKRYLCARDPDYIKRLSPASLDTLRYQGGPMNRHEMADFESRPWYRVAMAVRVYDDLGKTRRLDHPDLDYYLGIVRRCIHA